MDRRDGGLRGDRRVPCQRPRPLGAAAGLRPAVTTSSSPSPRLPRAEFQIGSNRGNVIVSPDGTKIAFVAATSKATTLWVRSLAVDDARSLSGTDGASYHSGRPTANDWVFREWKLRTVDIAGGLPEAIADAPAGRGGSWTEDGSILFTPTGGATVFKFAATGGDVKPVTKLDATRGEDAHYWPVVLPGGSRFPTSLEARALRTVGSISPASTAQRHPFVLSRRCRAECWLTGR